MSSQQLVQALCYESNVSGSIYDGVFGTSHWHNPSGRTMDLGSNRLLTETSTRGIFWVGGGGGKGGGGVGGKP